MWLGSPKARTRLPTENGRGRFELSETASWIRRLAVAGTLSGQHYGFMLYGHGDGFRICFLSFEVLWGAMFLAR